MMQHYKLLCSFYFFVVKSKPSKLQCAEMDVASCEDIRHNECYDNVPYDNRMCYKKSDIRTCRVSWHYCYHYCIFTVQTAIILKQTHNKLHFCLSQGDSGGGVIYDNKIYGVHKGSSRCGCTRLSVSVKVCAYIEWINDEMKK